MAIRERKVKNKRNSQGILTGRSGIVYDVNVKVYENGRQKSIAKRGFATRREAELYEAQIKLELQTGSAAMVGYGPESKQKLKEYLPKWYESYHHNLAKSTRYSYWSGINIHLIPMLGEVSLNKLTPQMIDDMIAQLREKGLAENSVRYCHRILSSALSSAVKYGYIPNNPAKNIMTRFSKNAGRKYDKYTVEQVQQLLAFVHGNALETVVLLAVLFGLRLSEALGLRWRDVDLTHRQITLRGQIPCDLPKDAKIVPHLEPLKDRDEGETRSFPITEEALPIFLRLRQEQADQRRLCKLGGVKYYDNDLVVCKPDGSPYLQKRISAKFNGFMRSTGMPKIRFHDLRGTAGTNMYNLTGDFYAVSQILGHSVDDFSQQMGVNLKINTVTTRYVQVQEQRKLSVLTAYHQAVFATPKNAAVRDNSL